MTPTLLSGLDSLAAWRRALDRGVKDLGDLLDDSSLLDAAAQALAASVRQRLGADRLVLAFVAEFSRGKSELINALFFGDTGRRVLPATPGRTTMCPVELGWDAKQAPSLSLLSIHTRSNGQTLAALREQPAQWQTLPLRTDDPDIMALTFQQVVRTVRVSLAEARALGLWSDEHPEDNPPRDAQDGVEVPAWRHALINYPHPLLKRGLVVVDTPGLNAIGTEPELTLSLLPSAHAAVFLLAADTGVTRSDLAVWRDHLGDRGFERFVVLNKIDTLADPLLTAAQIEAQIARQARQVASTLGIDIHRVFPLSARQALAARIQHDDAALAASRVPALEQALLNQLMPQRAQVVGRMVEDSVLSLQQSALRRLAERQRQTAEQLLELQGLRGKSAARLRLVSGRLAAEDAEFEACAPRLAALRSVLARELQVLTDGLGLPPLRLAVQRMRADSDGSLFKLRAARAFAALGQQLRDLLTQAGNRADSIQQMLSAGQQGLNADFGFALAVGPRPALHRFERELASIEEGYSRYVGFTQVWRLAQPGFLERFSQMLLLRLQGVFDGAAAEIEAWAQATSTQIDDQLRERRRAVMQRREAHQRIRAAEDGLERSIQDLELAQGQARALSHRLAAEVDTLRCLAACPPAATAGAGPAADSDSAARTARLQLVQPSNTVPIRGAA